MLSVLAVDCPSHLLPTRHGFTCRLKAPKDCLERVETKRSRSQAGRLAGCNVGENKASFDRRLSFVLYTQFLTARPSHGVVSGAPFHPSCRTSKDKNAKDQGGSMHGRSCAERKPGRSGLWYRLLGGGPRFATWWEPGPRGSTRMRACEESHCAVTVVIRRAKG